MKFNKTDSKAAFNASVRVQCATLCGRGHETKSDLVSGAK